MELENSLNRFKVVIIGAGLSGLSAAKWLQEWGVSSYVVLEARDRVGGRTLTKMDPNVNHVDLGAAYVGPSQNHVLRLIKELGVDTYKINEEEKVVYFRENGGRILHLHDDLPVFWNPLINMDLNHIYRTIDELGKEIPCDCPWKAPHAQEWDNMTVKEFGEKYLFSNTARDYLHSLCTAFIANDAYESSFLWFLWYIKNCQGTKRMMSCENGAEEMKCLGGMQQLSIKLAATLRGEVVLNKSVCKIDQSKEAVYVSTLDGATYQADYIILALPPALQMKIHFNPPLPPLRNQLIQRAPMGSVLKVFMYYEHNFWREKGMCGTMLAVGGDDYPVVSTLDDTKPDGSFPAIIGFITGDKARKVFQKTQQERKDLVAKSYSKIFNCPEALSPIHYEEHNWMAEEYSGGGYTAVYPPGCFTMYGSALREPIHRVYLAGTETSHVWSGYMDGAIAAGERAAREILHAMGKISKDDIWREEPELKDFPALPLVTSFWERYLPSATGFLRSVSFGTILMAFTVLCFNYNKCYKMRCFNFKL